MGCEELCYTIITSNKQGMLILEIIKVLKLQRVQVHQVVNRFQDTGGIKDRQQSGKPRNIKKNQGAEFGCEQENLVKFTEKHEKTRPGAWVSNSTMQLLVRGDLGLKVCKPV